MADIVWDNSTLEVQAKYPDLVNLVWQQIHKDFNLEALEFYDCNVSSLEDIYYALYPEITHLIKSNTSGLMRLLYRIDVSEKSVQKQMDLMPYDTGQAITILIVQREIKKIILRKQYGGK